VVGDCCGLVDSVLSRKHFHNFGVVCPHRQKAPRVVGRPKANTPTPDAIPLTFNFASTPPCHPFINTVAKERSLFAKATAKIS
jgi:hypothetical protein